MNGQNLTWKAPLVFTLLFASQAFNIMPAMASTPVEKRVPVEHVYTPHGFDDNDRTELVITGHLPNLCHQSPITQAKLQDGKIKVEVTSLYYDESNPFCPKMKVPFIKTVSVGLLVPGKYPIEVNGKQFGEGVKNFISIEKASTDSIDDHVYAAVAEIEKNEEAGLVTIKGFNPSDCFVLDKIDYVSNGKDTYSVLPVMKQVYSHCPMKMTPFSAEFSVPTDIPRKKVLLHVRSMTGNAVNTIFTRHN